VLPSLVAEPRVVQLFGSQYDAIPHQDLVAKAEIGSVRECVNGRRAQLDCRG
jgi:hypothetical protein